MSWALTHPHTITDVLVTHVMGTNSPPHHHRCWLLNFALTTIWMVLSLFGPEDTMSIISRNNLNVDWSDHSTPPLCVSPSQVSWGPEEPAGFLGVVDTWLSLCMVEFYLALVDLARNCD